MNETESTLQTVEEEEKFYPVNRKVNRLLARQVDRESRKAAKLAVDEYVEENLDGKIVTLEQIANLIEVSDLAYWDKYVSITTIADEDTKPEYDTTESK